VLPAPPILEPDTLHACKVSDGIPIPFTQFALSPRLNSLFNAARVAKRQRPYLPDGSSVVQWPCLVTAKAGRQLTASADSATRSNLENKENACPAPRAHHSAILSPHSTQYGSWEITQEPWEPRREQKWASHHTRDSETLGVGFASDLTKRDDGQQQSHSLTRPMQRSLPARSRIFLLLALSLPYGSDSLGDRRPPICHLPAHRHPKGAKRCPMDGVRGGVSCIVTW
jgi:hypothetical protein